MICDVSSVHPKVLVDYNHCGDVCDMSTRAHRVWHYRNTVTGKSRCSVSHCWVMVRFGENMVDEKVRWSQFKILQNIVAVGNKFCCITQILNGKCIFLYTFLNGMVKKISLYIQFTNKGSCVKWRMNISRVWVRELFSLPHSLTPDVNLLYFTKHQGQTGFHLTSYVPLALWRWSLQVSWEVSNRGLHLISLDI